MRYVHAFPSVAKPPDGMPKNGHEWEQLYRGAALALGVSAVREVVAASYDRILIDEYQDCGGSQHALAIALSSIVPTVIFGDPMQGIFEFSGATLEWTNDIHPYFPFAGTLETPHRWHAKNPDLGAWIAETRDKLMCGEFIDLADPRITYRESDKAFDMGALFDGIDAKEGSVAAIHCNKSICYKLAKATGGGYQAIEEMASNRLREFAEAWDGASDARSRWQAFASLLSDCIKKAPGEVGSQGDQNDADVNGAFKIAALGLKKGDGLQAARELLALSRKHPRWRLFRNELWRDTERALLDVSSGRCETVLDALNGMRQRVSMSGRKLPKRTVSTPLLLKGLEFDHVVLVDATHYAKETKAQAKLFYVAISRATQSLTIASSERYLRFPVPRG
jgi:DNA helicase-2/ATP-dependent DNA helicase PcrA